MLTSEIEIKKSRNQNVAFLFNDITTEYKSLQINKNIGQKLIISSDFGYVSNILTLPSIISVGKQDGGFKTSLQYFSKMLPTPGPTDPSLHKINALCI